MDENKEAAMEMRIKNLERKVEEIQEHLGDSTRPRRQRDTRSSPAPQRDARNYGSDPDENPFAPKQEDGPFGPYRS